MYAVVAPGIKGVYRRSRDIERILKVYPYARFVSLPTEEQCYQWLSTNSTQRKLEVIRDYGNAFEECHVIMNYFVRDGYLYVNCDTSNFGQMRIQVPDYLDIQVDQQPYMVSFKLRFTQRARPIQENLIALMKALQIIGDQIDVVIKVPDHSIFYALRSYTGKDPIVLKAQEMVNTRSGGTSVSLVRPYKQKQKQVRKAPEVPPI